MPQEQRLSVGTVCAAGFSWESPLMNSPLRSSMEPLGQGLDVVAHFRGGREKQGSLTLVPPADAALSSTDGTLEEAMR